jgi:hypothetical protein
MRRYHRAVGGEGGGSRGDRGGVRGTGGGGRDGCGCSLRLQRSCCTTHDAHPSPAGTITGALHQTTF